MKYRGFFIHLRFAVQQYEREEILECGFQYCTASQPQASGDTDVVYHSLSAAASAAVSL